MNALIAYSIPISGLKIGFHTYDFTLDKEFFSHFEASPVTDGQVAANVVLDKRPDMLILDITIGGHVGAICDRCTADINLPIENEGQLLVKYGESDDEDDEVVFIHRDTFEFNVAQYLYEYVVVSLPFINAYDCENDPEPACNFEVLGFLSTESDIEPPSNPIWDSLKDLQN